jgi:2-polyprenyl-3-methyl-5-hydroxy-6-metoxy-1,4-benzoquinol methylase
MKMDAPGPNPLLDPLTPGIQSTALTTAAAIGLFDALAEASLEPADLAKRLACDPVGIERLGDLLATMGYLETENGRYALSEVSRAAYVPQGELPLTDWLRFCEIQLRALGQLKAAVQTGRRVDLFDIVNVPAERLTHQRAMAQTARPAAEWVAAQVPVPQGAGRMLDAGGGHGIYSAALCRRHPPLAAEILELPATLAAAAQVAQEYGCDPYVTHRPGDIRTTVLEGRYAVVFLGNLVHHLTANQLRAVLTKIAAHTDPGGTIAIWDLAMTATDKDPVAASFALFFYLTSGAGCHSMAALKAALAAAGFRDVDVKHPPQGTTHMLVTARRS